MRGLLIGLSIAAPVGPIGVLCIRRTLAYGWSIGLITGLGAASADAFYAGVAGFGLTIISTFLINQAVWIRLVGGIFLLFLGIRTFKASPGSRVPESDEVGLAGAYLSTFVLTITNPLTILSFAAIFAGLGLGSQDMGFFSASILILGVFSGSALWWLSLSGFVSLFRNRVGEQAMLWINRISGAIILGFGIVAIGSVVETLVDIFNSM